MTALPMDPASVLRRVRDRLAVPERWTKGTFARDQDDAKVRATSTEAVCWCLGGAVLKETGMKWLTESPFLEPLLRLVYPKSIAVWNDASERTHTEVLALLDRAIEETER